MIENRRNPPMKHLDKAEDETKSARELGMVRVIRDCRNARRDYLLPRDIAKLRYNNGTLYYDETNQCYCED